MDIHITDVATVNKYRQGSVIADCLICRRCGVLVGVTYEENEQVYATVNCRVIEGDPDFGDEIHISPKKLSTEGKR